MQIECVEDKIKGFLDKKFRYSKSFATHQTYRLSMKRFQEFLRTRHNLDINQVLKQFEAKTLSPIEMLDEYYTFLASYKLKNGRSGYSSTTMMIHIVVAKEFLNSQNMHIYNEDLKQKFRLPKKEKTFENGLTKEILVRLLHNSSPKLQTAILICASSGMRIGELVQLRISDIDFSTNPTTIRLRKETTKTRDTRVVCISTEATNSLKDFLRRNFGWNDVSKEDMFVFITNSRDCGEPEKYDLAVRSTKNTLVQTLELVVKTVPELAMKNENGRNNIHFHAFRSWFKTQVTNEHQSDFAEAMMGHTSIKLAYYRQNTKDRLKTYLEVESALTVSDFTKVEQTMEGMQSKIDFLTIELEKVKQERQMGEKYQRVESIL